MFFLAQKRHPLKCVWIHVNDQQPPLHLTGVTNQDADYTAGLLHRCALGYSWNESTHKCTFILKGRLGLQICFLFFGGGALIRNQVCVKICLLQCAQRLLSDVGPHIFNGSEPAGYWQKVEHAVLHTDPDHPRHPQWVTCLLTTQVMQEQKCLELLLRDFFKLQFIFHLLFSLKMCNLQISSNTRLQTDELWLMIWCLWLTGALCVVLCSTNSLWDQKQNANHDYKVF